MSRTNRNAHKPQPVTVQEALQILQSAIGYLQLAGMTVQAMNQADGLTLVIPNAYYCTDDDGTVAAFRIGTPSAPNNGTPTR